MEWGIIKLNGVNQVFNHWHGVIYTNRARKPHTMPRKSRFSRRRGKGKWRQQKLAVGTVQRIAREIAKKEDRKNLQKYCHVSQQKADAYTWSDLRALPAMANWKSFTGSIQDTGLIHQVISDVGGNIQVSDMVLLSSDEKKQVEIRIHGLEVFGVVANQATRPARFEVRVLWIPNLNTFTNASIDYLQPRITMFYKSGKGVGNLLRQGYDRKQLTVSTATGIPITFKTVARKVLYLPAASVSGTMPGGGLSIATPIVFKRFTLKKYFKNPKKGFVEGDDDEMTNGNYVLCYWNDLSGTQSMSILATSNFQYSLASARHNDLAVGA